MTSYPADKMPPTTAFFIPLVVGELGIAKKQVGLAIFCISSSLWNNVLLVVPFQPHIQLLRVEPPCPAHFVSGNLALAGEVIEGGLAHFYVVCRFFKGQPVRHYHRLHLLILHY